MRAINAPLVSRQCDCKKGYRSRIDAKCENCRNKSDKIKLNQFWKDVTELGISVKSPKFNILRVLHFGAAYVIN